MKGIIVLIYALMLASTSCSKKNGPAGNAYINSAPPTTLPFTGNEGGDGTNIGDNQDDDGSNIGDNGDDDGSNIGDNEGDDNCCSKGNDGYETRTEQYFTENGQKRIDTDIDCRDGFKIINGEKLKCANHVKQRIVISLDNCKKSDCKENNEVTRIIEKKQKRIKKEKRKTKNQKVTKVKKEKRVKKQKTEKVAKVKKQKEEGPGLWERIFGKKKEKVKKQKTVKVKKEKKQKAPKVAKVKAQKVKKKKVVKVKKEKKQKEPKVAKEKKQKVQKKKIVKVKKEKKQKAPKVAKEKKQKVKKKKIVKVKKEKKQKEPKVAKEKKQKVQKKKIVKVKKQKEPKQKRIVKQKVKKQKEPKKKIIVEETREIETPIQVEPIGPVVQQPVIEIPVVDIKPIVVEEPKEEVRDKKANPAELVEGITSQFGVESDNLDIESVRNNSLSLNLLKTRFKNADVCTLKTPLAANDFVKLNAKGYPVDLNRTLSLNDITLVNLNTSETFVADLELTSLFADILNARLRSANLVFDTNPEEVLGQMSGSNLVPSYDYESYKVTPGTSVNTFLHKASTVIKDANGNKVGSRKVTIYFTKDQINGLEITTQDGGDSQTYCIAN